MTSGMHGLWTGTVTHVGVHKGTHSRPGRMYFVLAFRKRNGAAGVYRCEAHELFMCA